MPTPEREREARQPSLSAVSMKDLLASCAAATAVSTPPREENAEEAADDLDGLDDLEDAGDGTRLGRRTTTRPPARRDAA